MKQEDKAERLVQGQFDVLISKLCNATMIAHERIPSVDVDSIREAIGVLSDLNTVQPVGREPLTDEDIDRVAVAFFDFRFVNPAFWRDYARAIEAAHGITAPQQKGGAA